MRKFFAFFAVFMLSVAGASAAPGDNTGRAGTIATALNAGRAAPNAGRMMVAPITTPVNLGNLTFNPATGAVSGPGTGGGGVMVKPSTPGGGGGNDGGGVITCASGSHVDTTCAGPDGTIEPNCTTRNCRCNAGTTLQNGVCSSGGVTPPVNSECPDGGVKNSTYNIESCMNDVLACVNNGALPGGLNDLFDENVRNSIFTSSQICYLQIDKCVADVRMNCRNVYPSAPNVWNDFNSRRVQPEYFNFTLRKTGLTPNQAENTCLLLDYPEKERSFLPNNQTYVGNPTISQTELGNAYMSAGERGSRDMYARWDAKNAECLVRVAAYKKNNDMEEPITNDWLFGLAGDRRRAEVWQPVGTSFKCGKDLFEFSLLNSTYNVAVVGGTTGLVGGSIVGATAGWAGVHGSEEFSCSDEDHRDQLAKEIRDSRATAIFNEYIGTTGGDAAISPSAVTLTENQCKSVAQIVALHNQARSIVETENCADGKMKLSVFSESEIAQLGTYAAIVRAGEATFNNQCLAGAAKNAAAGQAVASARAAAEVFGAEDPQAKLTLQDMELYLARYSGDTSRCGDCPWYPTIIEAKNKGIDIHECGGPQECVTLDTLKKEVDRLTPYVDALKILDGLKSNRLKGALIGAGIGTGAAGLATLITSFVEKNNINCRVGNDLERVGYNKTHTIGTLRDFYVKWALRVPERIIATNLVTDCKAYQDACAIFTNLNQCTRAAVNYKTATMTQPKIFDAACSVSGSVCQAKEGSTLWETDGMYWPDTQTSCIYVPSPDDGE